jgi:hydrogenase maturation factor
MADASNLGVRVFEERILVEPETAKICRYFEIDPLQLISSGALLVAADPGKTGEIMENLRLEHVYAAEIGEFGGNVNKRLLIRKDGTAQELPRPVSDHLWQALARK